MTDERALSVIQLRELSALEKTIEVNLKSFYEVGLALMKIRDDRLYRENYKTFEEYCRERWGMVASRARQLIATVEVQKNLESVTTVTPTSERQLRPLTSLEPEQQKEVWKEAVDTAPEGKVTAEHVTHIVRERNLKEIKEKAEQINQKSKKVKKFPKLGPPSIGLQYARMAILDLEQITDDDLERDDAFSKVKNWIVEHE